MKSFSIVMVIDDGEYFKMLVKKVERWNIRNIGCVWNSKSKKKIDKMINFQEMINFD